MKFLARLFPTPIDMVVPDHWQAKRDLDRALASRDDAGRSNALKRLRAAALAYERTKVSPGDDEP